MEVLNFEIEKLTKCITLRYPPEFIVNNRIIKDYVMEANSFTDFYSSMKDKKNISGDVLIIEELANIWTYFKSIVNAYDEIHLILKTEHDMIYSRDTHAYYSKLIESIASNINNEYKIQEMEAKITYMKELRSRYDEILDLRREDYENETYPSVILYRYNIKGYTYNIYMKDVNEYLYFDSIVTDKLSPFAVLKKMSTEDIATGESEKIMPEKIMYKTYSDIRYPQQWIETVNMLSGVRHYIFTGQEMVSFPDKKSRYAELFYDTDSKMLAITYDNKRSLPTQKLKERISTYMPLVSFNNQTSVTINAHFYTKNIDINNDFILYLIYSDPILSNVCYFNEAKRTAADKKVLKLNIIFGTRRVTATITPAMVTKSTKLVNRDTGRRERVDTGKLAYLQVQLKRCRNEQEIRFAMDFIEYLFSVYEEEAATLEADIKDYIPDYSYKVITEVSRRTESADISRELDKLKYLNPEFFISKMASLYQGHYPSYVETEQEAIDLINEGVQVIRIPARITNSPGDVQFSYNKEPMYFYADTTGTNKYMGLKLNTLSNADLYPYVPLVYKKQHLTVAYESKFHNQKITSLSDEDWDITITDFGKAESTTIKKFKHGSFLNNGRLRYPPSELEFIFSDIPEFFILGLQESPLSLISAIQFSISQDGVIDQSESALATIIEDIISRYNRDVDTRIFDVAKQELYDMTDDEIIYMLRNDIVKSKYVIRMIEYYFNINLFIFTTSEKQLTKLELPRYKEYHLSYYNYSPDRKTICLWAVSSKEDTQYYPFCDADRRPLDFDNDIYLDTLKEYIKRSLRITDINGNLMEQPSPPPSIDGYSIYQQHVDGYGKVYAISYINRTNQILLLSTPKLPILTNEEGDAYPIRELPTTTIVPQLNLPNGYMVMRRRPNEVENYKILSQTSRRMKGIISILYALTTDTLDEFRDRFVIDLDTEYNLSNVPFKNIYFDTYERAIQYFGEITSGLLTRNDKIIALSDEHVDSLIQYCRYRGKNIPTMFIPDYYVEPFDYKRYTPHQIISYNATQYKLVLQVGNRDATTLQSIYEPYYLRLNDNVYLIQFAEGSLEKAASILYLWYESKKNYSFYSPILKIPTDFRYKIVSAYDFRVASRDEKTIIYDGSNYYAILSLDN